MESIVEVEFNSFHKTKGQLISKSLLGDIVSTQKTKQKLRIFTLASKKRGWIKNFIRPIKLNNPWLV
jgi:hypothetical protein